MLLFGLPALGLLAAGLGIAYAVFEREDPDSAGSAFSEVFCRDAADWHTAQGLFLARVDEPESLEGDGLSETARFFSQVTEAVQLDTYPESDKDIAAALGRTVAVLRRTLAAEEEWLFELSVLDAVISLHPETETPQRLDAARRVETKMLELNQLLPEANLLLRDGCGLKPLKITTGAQPAMSAPPVPRESTRALGS